MEQPNHGSSVNNSRERSLSDSEQPTHESSVKKSRKRSSSVEPNHGSSVKKSRKRSSSRQTTHQSTSKHNFPDLISALPDSLLLHILSLLDMEEVMKTSLLSRRWKYLWKSIPCLCFNPFGRLFDTIDLSYFINRCLFHHEGSKIRKLHIIFNYKDIYAALADSWLHFAMKCKVEDFKLDLLGGDCLEEEIPDDKLYRLSRCLYLCTTLTSLNLSGCDLNLPDSFQLGSLKKLSLQYLVLYSDSIERLSSSCPVLEDIYIIDCNRERDLNIVITNVLVKRLVIDEYGGQCGFGTIEINAPTLLSLGIYNCYPSVWFHVEELGSLMSVDLIGHYALIFSYKKVYLRHDRNCLEELLHNLRHVKHLKLCSLCLQVLSLMKLHSSDILSISATYLELNPSLRKWELPGIRYLLESCSNLQELKIVTEDYWGEIELPDEFIDKHDFEEEEYWASLETDVPSTMQNIKSIMIDLGGESHHEEFIRFLLKNTKVLERMVINTPKGHAKYNYELLFKLSQRLHAFPRSSPNAKLFIT